MSSPDKDKWIQAMKEELDSLLINKTWILVKKPKKRKLVSCKWIFKRKIEMTKGKETIRFKARLVARGFTQRDGIDFNEVFSPVVKHCSIRILLAMVTHFDMELEQLDVKTAFLHGDLEETIYMHQPEGFILEGDEDKVCLLKKSLYGLKQSSRQWYLKFDEYMSEIGYTKSKYDSCVYMKKAGKADASYLLLYVDDMLIASRSQDEIENLKFKLQQKFEMKFLGNARRILRMDILRDRKRGLLKLIQEDYILRVLKKFNMHESRSVSILWGSTSNSQKDKSHKMMQRGKKCGRYLMPMP